MHVLVRGLLDALIEPRCLVCARAAWASGERPLCTGCASLLPRPARRCRLCGRRVGLGHVSAGCAACTGPLAHPDALAVLREGRSRALDGVTVGAAYAGPPRTIVHALKFRRRIEAAGLLAEPLVAALLAAGLPGDLVVPIPLSRRREWARGFNQAALLGYEIARAFDLPHAPRALRRIRHLAPQARRRGRTRLLGLGGVFVARRRVVTGRCIILVDDVLTTGATARAAAKALRRRGARRVHLAVACRTEPPRM